MNKHFEKGEMVRVVSGRFRGFIGKIEWVESLPHCNLYAIIHGDEVLKFTAGQLEIYEDNTVSEVLDKTKNE